MKASTFEWIVALELRAPQNLPLRTEHVGPILWHACPLFSPPSSSFEQSVAESRETRRSFLRRAFSSSGFFGLVHCVDDPIGTATEHDHGRDGPQNEDRHGFLSLVARIGKENALSLGQVPAQD